MTSRRTFTQDGRRLVARRPILTGLGIALGLGLVSVSEARASTYRVYTSSAASSMTPRAPLLFLKPSSSVIGDGGLIVLPGASTQVEFEGEIGVVMGGRLRNGSREEAELAVGAIVALNDVTARDLQRSDGQWTRAKGFDTFCPIGTANRNFGRLADLELITRLNGIEKQRGKAAEMVFDIPAILVYISEVMTLDEGDVVATGTPAGVGKLHDGDVVEVEIVGVSRVTNKVTVEK
jgi:2-keto-4-pentenoate hydratase/2-oxohepta-3-ene-1,7-dioic acid hydratase in catechol pathway